MEIPTIDRAATGVAGLDDVLVGGLARGRIYLLEGHPRTGKTMVAIQFLAAGAVEGEKVLYITLSETEDELRASAASHGWTMDGIAIFELIPPENLLDEQQQQSLLYSSDLELGETTRRIFEVFERVRPSGCGRYAMASAVVLRDDFDGAGLRRLARLSGEANQHQ